MYSHVEIITPAIANEILTSRNPANRPLSRERVRRYSTEMREGRWVLTPQGIAFDPQQNLLDGQHRLAAVVQTGLPARFYVHHDVPREALKGLDQGLGRTAAQMASLELEGSSVPTSRITSAARVMLEYGFNTTKPTNNQIVAFARDHAAVIERFAPVGKQYTAGVHAAFSYGALCNMQGIGDAADRLIEMRWSGDDDPMRALARALGSMGQREGQRAQRTRFFTTIAALEYVDRDEPLMVARKYETMPARVKDSVQAHAAAATMSLEPGPAVANG